MKDSKAHTKEDVCLLNFFFHEFINQIVQMFSDHVFHMMGSNRIPSLGSMPRGLDDSNYREQEMCELASAVAKKKAVLIQVLVGRIMYGMLG